MAVLEIGVDTAAVSPVRRGRKPGALLLVAVGWIALIVLAAALADFLPIGSPTDMDMLARRALRPVERMASRADRIGVDRLTERIPVPDTRDELAHSVPISEAITASSRGIGG